eukprot:s2056_g4.t2
MLRVYWASGKLALALEPEEFARVAAGPSPVRGLKEHLQSQCKRSRFRQRLLRDGALLGEDATLELPLELQLVILPFSHATDLQITELRRAVERDQLQEVEAILQRPQDADLSVARDWTTALHVAAEHGFVAAARLLQEACADVDRPDIVGSTPLLVAAKNGHLSMARWLLEARADLNAKCFAGGNGSNGPGRSFGPTPLFMAALTGRLEVARLLLDARADKEKSEAHSTPLFVASQQGHRELVQLLLEANANKDSTNEEGATPLLKAAERGHAEVARLLLEAGASKDKADCSGSTPLFVSCVADRLEVVRLLLAFGVDKDAENKYGDTPFSIACRCGHMSIADLLRESGAHQSIDAGSAAPEELHSYMTSRAMPEAPQGRGDIGLDPQIDGYWLYSGRFCMYVLRSYGVVYAGSAIVLKVVVNNPIFALPRRDPQNVWTLRLRGSTAPLAAATTALPRTGALAALADVSERLRKNVPVLGVLRDATVMPQFFGAGITRNWLSVFFTAEQGGPGNGGAVELRVPEGFSFPPSCLTQPLPAFHYATPSAQLAGTAALRSTAPLAVRRCRVGGVPNIAEVTLPSSARIAAGSTYGFEIQVFNAVQYSVGQQDGFRLTTRSAAGDDMDATYHTIRYVASDTEGPGTSFGVYQEPMPAGSFVLSFDSMLPYSESGLATRVVVFPLKVPFDSLDPVTWRLVAPLGFIWDFRPAEFLYRRQDILGVTADLPLETAPASPSTEPLAILAVVDNFQGNWDRTQTYGLVARIRVPDGTPLASSNVFLLEFGYDATTAAGRRAAASAPAPQVRALVNFHVDYFRTSLAGQQNVLTVQFQSITALPVGGSLLLDSPAGFAVEESCALQAAAVVLPYQDLAATSAALLCSAFVPATTQRPQVTLRVVTGEVSAGPYVMALAARNPLVPELGGLVWRLSSFTNAVDAEVADLGSTVEGFQVESMMNFGGLLGPESGVNPATTGRDDHPGQVTNVILAFDLASTPTGAGESTLTVKAPTGFSFPALCTVVVTGDVFGPGALIPLAFSAFEASAVVSTCEGGGRTARLSVAPGLIRNRRYVMRLQGVNGEETAEQNLWTISFAGEATEPFEGYRLWRFTEVAVLPDATARSTPAEETRNNVTLRFRTTSAVTSAGFVALQAPFGYVFPTLCQATLQELDAADTPIAGSGVVSCSGTPLPGPTAALHPVGSSMLAALVKYQLNVVVQNPTVIALEAGTWQIQSYATKEADYSNLLDIGEAPGFHLTEVFHTLRIIYPLATPSTIDELELRMQILLSTSLEIGDVLEIVAPDGYDVTGNSTSEFDNLQRACNKFRQWSAAALPIPTCNVRVVHFEFATTGLAVVDVPGAQALTPLMDFSVTSLYPRKTLSVQATTFHGEQRRGTAVVSAKTVPGQLVTPRLLEISVVRADAFVAVQSLASLQLTFRVSQDAQALHITTEVQDAASQAEPLRFDFAAATAIVVGTEVSQVFRSNASLLLHMALEQGRGYSLTLGSVANPSTPGTALWTLTSYVLAEDGSLDLADPRDRSVNFAGPVTLNRLSIDPSSTSLTDPFFDIVNTELSLSFVAFPRVVTGGQFLVLSAPADFAFLEKSFSPGEGFPLISGQVAVVELEGSRPSYAVQILSPILPSQAVKFSVRLRTPTAPEDLSLWATTHRSNLLLQTCRDSQCQDPTASNDDLFPGFEMKASFGTASITPQANGAAPQLDVTVTLRISPKATLASLIESGTVHLRIRHLARGSESTTTFKIHVGAVQRDPSLMWRATYCR